MGDAVFTSAQKKQLREEGVKERRLSVAKQFRALVAEAEAIPLRVKTQYPVYLDVKVLHLMRGVAKIEGVSVQELIRAAIQEKMDVLMRLPKRGGTGKKVSPKKRA